jgi:hypothetical protein
MESVITTEPITYASTHNTIAAYIDAVRKLEKAKKAAEPYITARTEAEHAVHKAWQNASGLVAHGDFRFVQGGRVFHILRDGSVQENIIHHL